MYAGEVTQVVFEHDSEPGASLSTHEGSAHLASQASFDVEALSGFQVLGLPEVQCKALIEGRCCLLILHTHLDVNPVCIVAI